MFFGTFKSRDRFNRRYVVIEAPTIDLAKKRMIDLFGRQWENIYTSDEWNDPNVLKRMRKEKYSLLENAEIKREFERASRIKYKTIKF